MKTIILLSGLLILSGIFAYLSVIIKNNFNIWTSLVSFFFGVIFAVATCSELTDYFDRKKRNEKR